MLFALLRMCDGYRELFVYGGVLDADIGIGDGVRPLLLLDDHFGRGEFQFRSRACASSGSGSRPETDSAGEAARLEFGIESSETCRERALSGVRKDWAESGRVGWLFVRDRLGSLLSRLEVERESDGFGLFHSRSRSRCRSCSSSLVRS